MADKALLLWVRERLTHGEIAERLKTTRQTVARWSKTYRWEERRQEQIQADREELADRLHADHASVVSSTYESVTRLVDRMSAFLLCGGEFCPHCGRGDDSGHPLQRVGEPDEEYALRKNWAARNASFRVTTQGLEKLMRLRLELVQVHGRAPSETATGPVPEYPAELVKALADTYARGAKVASEMTELRRRVEALERFQERARAEFGDEPVMRLLEAA